MLLLSVIILLLIKLTRGTLFPILILIYFMCFIIVRSRYFPFNKIVKPLKYLNACVVRKMIIYRRRNLKQYVLQNPNYKVPLIKLNLSSHEYMKRETFLFPSRVSSVISRARIGLAIANPGIVIGTRTHLSAHRS